MGVMVEAAERECGRGDGVEVAEKNQGSARVWARE